MMEGNFVQAKNVHNKMPPQFESLRDYMRLNLLPLINERDLALGK